MQAAAKIHLKIKSQQLFHVESTETVQGIPEVERSGDYPIIYVHSFMEKIQCVFTKHRVATVIKPQTTLRQV